MFLDVPLITNSVLKTSHRNSKSIPSSLLISCKSILADSIPILYTGCQTVESEGVK